jgi:hypothetical protein
MQQNWLKIIELELPEIIRIVKTCDEQYRQKCFELILIHALNTKENFPSNRLIDHDNITGVNLIPKQVDVEKIQDTGFNPKFNRFLSDNNLTLELLNNLIDLDTGEIISTKLGNKGSDITRNIAVLISLWHFTKGGEFSFKLNELVEKGKSYGVEFHNQKRDLKKAIFNDKRVFLENGEDWKIPTQTQGYVVKTIKELTELKN